MHDLSSGNAAAYILTPAARSLRWQDWEDIYIAYQASSAETHFFNETTALILQSLERGPISLAEAKKWTEAVLGVDMGELPAGDFEFATARLEELGLIESLDEAIARQ
ncbi:HPr-rel-A system PqqD family peptide chaperone [Accumulibacter sp.]|uniref:HPr-rel-A system PqqD family peptide chaperone n=1 Tax=Candidatus Accumulibacter proximus TaxID=2954385 RepID=A0A935UGA2_9PROT|nr:HPr-rel-A system PqqD family peptide chaperone [Accumulibacter sp.]MBK7675457.1 HPr-rel-A system PqqD family peptide chaperone [Candidatus Accumulibacter proximus]MBL8374217.1 HPr-rel-A system PqqD family peptide chaperone [Accumulibacter sp.]